MGAGIALTALRPGMAVVLVDPSDASQTAARAYLPTHLEKKGETTALDRAFFTSSLDDLTGCRIVVEADPEDPGMLQLLSGDLDRRLPPSVILATNTSTQSVTSIASVTEPG